MGKSKKSKILITGASGFIGTNLVKRLIETDSQIFTFSYPSTNERVVNNRIKDFVIDISDSTALEKLIKEIRPDKVFHLAAVIKNERSFAMVDEVLKNNIIGTFNLLKSLYGTGCQRIVNMSTCESYGQSEDPFLETQPLNPMSPYSASKASIDLFSRMLYQTLGSPVVTLRMTLVYGPYQKENMLIPQVILSVLRNEDFEMTQGEQTRNFIYVDDAIDALLLASNLKNIEGEIFNIGTTEEYTIREVVMKIISLMGNPTKPLFGKRPYRNPEIWRYRCNFDKARKVLNWSPRVNLDEGLQKTVDWHKERFITTKNKI